MNWRQCRTGNNAMPYNNRIQFRVNNASGTTVTLRSTVEKTSNWVLTWVLNVHRHSEDVTSDCSKFLLQQQGRLGHRSWRAVTVVQPVPRSMMSPGVVDQEVLRQAVKRQPGRLAQVHGHTGRPERPVCTLFALAHKTSADGKAAVWCCMYWTGRRVEPLHSWPPGDDLAGMMVYQTSVAFPKSSFIRTNTEMREWQIEWDSKQRMLRNCLKTPKQCETVCETWECTLTTESRYIAQVSNDCRCNRPGNMKWGKRCNKYCQMLLIKQLSEQNCQTQAWTYP